MLSLWRSRRIKKCEVIGTQLDCPNRREHDHIVEMFLQEHGPGFFTDAWSLESPVSKHETINRDQNINRQSERKHQIAGATNLITDCETSFTLVFVEAFIAVVCCVIDCLVDVDDNHDH